MDENNNMRRTLLSNKKEMSNSRTQKDGVSSKRRLDRESSFHALCRAIAKSPLELKCLENDKKKKERNGIQLSVESKLSEIANKRRMMTAHTYKAQYKQPVKMVVSDTDEAIEGPNTVVKDKLPASVDSEISTSLARLQDVNVHSHSETVKKCWDTKATETTLSLESSSDSVMGKNVCSKRKRISSDSTESDPCSCVVGANKNLGRLCTCKFPQQKRAQYPDESLCERNADSDEVRNKQRKGVDENGGPESVNIDSCSETDAKSVSAKLPDVSKEIRVKSRSEEHDKMILEIVKKCRKRQKKLIRKQQEEIQLFHKIWNEKRDQIDKDLQLETAFIRFLFSSVSVRTERLKRLNQAFAGKIKNHNLLKDVELSNLEAKQLVAMNEEKQKRECWLTEAKVCSDEPIAVNWPPPLMVDQTGVSQLSVNSKVDATCVVSESTGQVSDKNATESESTRHLQDEDPNANISPRNQNLEGQNTSVCANANASALANTSVSARVDPVNCDIPSEMKEIVPSDFPNKAVEKDMGGSSVDMVEKSIQLKRLRDNGEFVCARLPGFADQSVTFTALIIESSVDVPAKDPKENAAKDEIHSSFAVQINQNVLAVRSQCDPPVGDPVTTVQFNGELEEGEIQEFEGEMQEKTMGKQGHVSSETVAIVEHGKEEPIMEKQRTVNSETVANFELVLITEKPDGNVLVVGNQHTSEIHFEKMGPDSLTGGQSNVELQELVTRAAEIYSNSDSFDTVHPAQPIREQNTCDIEAPFSSHTSGALEAVVLSHEPVSQIEHVQPVTEHPQAETVGSRITCHIEAPISVQSAEMTELETLSYEAASQIDSGHPITEQLHAVAETIKSQNSPHIEALSSSKELQKGGNLKYIADHSSDDRDEFSEKPASRENIGQGPNVNNIQAGKTRNLSDKPSRSRSPTPSTDKQHGKSCHSSPIKVLKDARESPEENIWFMSPVRSSSRKRAHCSDSNDLSRSPSPEKAQKRASKGRGFTEQYPFVRKYPTASPEPDRSYLYGGREVELINNDSQSSRARFVRSPQGRCRSPADDDCSTGIHKSTSQIGSIDPVLEQPLADNETVENHNACLIQAPVQAASVAEFDALSQPTSQADTIQPILEQSRAGAEVAISQNTCHIEAHLPQHIADVAEAETLQREPASQISFVENQNASVIEPPLLSQIDNVVETQTEHTHSIIEQRQADEEPVPNQIADVVDSETLLHEPVSQNMENLDTGNISNERIVEFPTSSQRNEPICEGVIGEAELSIAENQIADEETGANQIADVVDIESLLHEPVSRSVENLETRNISCEQIVEIATSSQRNEPISEGVIGEAELSIADEETAASQIADVVVTEALLHAPVSQSVENLETRNISNEQIVKFTTSSHRNEPICEGVIGEAELSIGGVPHSNASASYLYGPGHLLPSLNAHSFDPIEFELGKTIKEKEEFERSHLNMEAQLKSNCEKEIEEMTNQIKQKYVMQLQVVEAEFRHRRIKFENYLNKLQMNKKLAEAFRNKLTDPGLIWNPVNQQGTSSVYVQQVQHLSLHPSGRVIPNVLNFQPSPGHSDTSVVGPSNMQHQSRAHPTRFSQITCHSVTAPPVHSRSHPDAGSVRSYMPHHSLGCSTRFSSLSRHSVTAPPVLPVQNMQAFDPNPPRPRPVMLSHNPHAPGEVSCVAPPHLQSFMHPVGLTTLSPIPPYQPTFQSEPMSQDGLLAETIPHSSTETMREMGPWSRVRANLSQGASEMGQNYTSLGLGVQGNNTAAGNSFSVVPADIVFLSDDD